MLPARLELGLGERSKKQGHLNGGLAPPARANRPMRAHCLALQSRTPYRAISRALRRPNRIAASAVGHHARNGEGFRQGSPASAGHRPQSSSASRFTAGAAGLVLDVTLSAVRPRWAARTGTIFAALRYPTAQSSLR
jgi:hypothetical protein